jgi:hypothetical protein
MSVARSTLVNVALVLGFFVVTPVLAMFAVAMAAGGHGSYTPAKSFFPYSMAATALTREITMPLMVAALVQYPAYGGILAWARSVGRFRSSLLALAATHFVAVVLAFGVSNPSFTP